MQYLSQHRFIKLSEKKVTKINIDYICSEMISFIYNQHQMKNLSDSNQEINGKNYIVTPKSMLFIKKYIQL